MKKARNIILIILIFVALICTGVYFFGVYYYRNWFCPNTYINGVNVSGHYFDETYDIVSSFYSASDITVKDKDGSEFVIKGSDVYFLDPTEYDRAVSVILETENSYYWPYYLFNKHEYKYTPNVYVNEKVLNEYIDNSFLSEKKRYNPNNKTQIVYSYYTGFSLWNDTTDLLDWDLAVSEIKNAVYERKDICDLSEIDCYKDVDSSNISKETIDEWDNIEKLIDFKLTYQLCTGQEIEVTASEVSKFIAKDASGGIDYDGDGNIIIHSDRIYDFVQKMSDDYDTFYNTQYFDTTRGDTVAIDYSRYTTYGSLIDVKKEAEILEDLIVNSKDRDLVREPEYIKKMERGNYLNGYNGTYVEVDLTAQHMYYYVDGKCVLDTDVVTGCQANGNMTPDCVCFILNKARNVTLIGPGYESFVYHWMCITGQIGIHDATWRSNFGGEIYKYNGSHGCVNTPLQKMDELFEMIEIGTPVFVFR